MSWTDEEIDNLFKDGAEAQSFEYDNSYFNEIEAALPVNRNGKDFLWMGTALVFIAVLTTGYFVNNANDTDTSFNATNNQLANLELNTNDNTDNSNASNEVLTSNGNQNESLKNTETNELNNELSSKENGSNSNTSVNKIASFNTNAGKSNSISSQNDISSKSQQTTSSNSMYSVATRNVGISRTNDANTVNTQSGQSGATGIQPGVLGSSSENLVNAVGKTDVDAQEQFAVENAPITASLNVNGANQLDQDLSQNLAPNAIPIGLGPIRPKAALYFELNTGASQSLITPSESVSKSIGGGIGVESYFGNFNLTTGVNFKASFHDDLFLTRTGKVYGFGSNAGTNEYDVQKIYSIEMPIALGYNFGRHNLNVGVRPSLIIGAQTKFQAFEDDQLLRTSQINGLIEEEINGENVRALMRIGVKPTFGYSYRINNWTVGANVGIQLMQSVNEDLIDGFNNQLPIDGQIYLRRTIRLRK